MAEVATLAPRARRRRPRLRPARRGLPVAARRPAGVAGGRAGGPPDARRRRRARHLQRRQAARRAAGRRHRRAAPTSSPPAPPIRWPGRCDPAASCSPRCRTCCWPTCAVTSATTVPFWRMVGAPDGRRSTLAPVPCSTPWAACRGAGRTRRPRRVAARGRVAPRHRHPVVRARRRRRPDRRAAARPIRPSWPASRRPDLPRPAHRRPGRRRHARDGAGRTSARSPVRVVATAGHVDHGKSSLVLALTGTDPDRFDEEKRRGLTIDLGFAHTVLPSGEAISFVDVPGHVRFLRNMLAGVGARRRLPVRRRRHRGLEAPERGAPAHPRAARRRPRRRRADEDRRGRRRVDRAGRPGRRRPRGGHVPGAGAGRARERVTGAGLDELRRRPRRARRRPPRRPAIGAAPASGWIACSPPRAAAPS